jgi:hypothetical protein
MRRSHSHRVLISTMERQEKNIVLIGHSYVRRNATFMREEERWRNLRLERTRVRVESCQVVGGKFAGANFTAALRHPFVLMADVLYLHLGENDYHPTKDPVFAARELYGKVVEHLGRARRVIISELFRFPKQPRWWCELINVELRRLVAAGSPRIRLWRHKRVLYSEKAFARDGTHLKKEYRKAYWEGVRYAVMSA